MFIYITYSMSASEIVQFTFEALKALLHFLKYKLLFVKKEKRRQQNCKVSNAAAKTVAGGEWLNGSAADCNAAVSGSNPAPLVNDELCQFLSWVGYHPGCTYLDLKS